MHWCEGENNSVFVIEVVCFTFSKSQPITTGEVVLNCIILTHYTLHFQNMTVENRVLNVHNVNVRTSGPGVELHDVTQVMKY